MPIYRYVCGKPRKDRCKLSDLPENYFNEDIEYSIDLEIERLIEWREDGTINAEKSFIVQLVYHRMFEEIDIKCPVCKTKAQKSIGTVEAYFPGNCYLNKRDIRRKMALHKLEHEDPYGYMRPEGDKEALVAKIKRGDKAAVQNFFPGGKGGLKAPSQHEPGT